MAKQENVYWPSSEETNIVPREIVDEVKQSMLQYSMSVLVGRAIPDVRDGLKPVHRRILYTMYENGLTPDKAYRKCADTVGSVLGRYHPHGDASVYDAMVRMAQDFSLRYPLIDGHGNFGNIDGYPAAAYRYTESRMNRLSLQMLDDIDKETVDFSPNYDNRLEEPQVLPVRFPQLLVNGASGIAVGMATEIPPHNLGEVIDGMCCLIDNPEADMQEICQHIKGPDFPTGGIIMGRSGIRAAYATGRGKIIVRGKAEIEETKNGKFRIVITEIPYKVKKQELVKHIYDLAAEKKIEGIDDVVDYSSKRDGGIRIIVDLKKDANPQVVLNKIYRYTSLQTTFGAILLAIVNGKPQILTLKEMLQNCIDFQYDIIYRRTAYDKRKAEERAHILEGLKVALDFIDEVISIIRSSKTIPDSKEALSERFGLDDIQTTAIVQMQLGKLAGLEKQKILDELQEKLDFIKECTEILGSRERILDIVKTESLNLRDKFSDDRRTEISDVAGEVDIEDLIPEEECVLTKTVNGYIKRLPVDTYNVQHRGGRGITGMTTREDDIIENMFVCSSHDYIMLFSNLGRMYRIKAYEIPEASSRQAKGMNMVNILPLMPEEKITIILPASELDEDKYICMGTKKGIIKRTKLSEFKNTRKTGIIAISIDEDDELSFVKMTNGDENLLVATRNGMAIQFKETDVRAMGRTARGVKAITLRGDDEVVAMAVTDENTRLLTVTETGYGRISNIDNYRVQSRGGKGLTNYRVDKYGKVAAVLVIGENDDIVMIASNGIIIRIFSGDISCFARPAKGVRVMRVAEGEKILSIATAEHNEEEITDKPEEADADAGDVGDISSEEAAEETEVTAEE
ncbi:MAG: DNA gyrase subunit A [Clostridia bacterium]|nr:DNA gyrase subunit A [Clostridia bacterium]MEE1185537.1 DNA gyrase subunit A [Acutalibacteraceae bacterium]